MVYTLGNRWSILPMWVICLISIGTIPLFMVVGTLSGDDSFLYLGLLASIGVFLSLKNRNKINKAKIDKANNVLSQIMGWDKR